ncbi:hypothetical protein BDN72DRAFT_744711, partial [Pluteus cervinus]
CQCGDSTEVAYFRCRDCISNMVYCRTCIINQHRCTPFHCIEKWEGRFFGRTSLHNIGFVLHLGHDGHPCPHSLPDKGRLTVIVDSTGFHSHDVHYCCCPASPEEDFPQLLQSSLFPATLNKPRTAFTFNLLKDIHVHGLTSKKSVYDYHDALRRLTDPVFPGQVPDRLDELMLILRVWRFKTTVRRSGQAHNIDDSLPLRKQHSLGVRCPACPEVGFNVERKTIDEAPESDWFVLIPFIELLVPKTFVSHKYTLFLSCDGNYRLQRMHKREDPDDVALNNGHAFFVQDDEFKEHIKNMTSETTEDSTCAHLRAHRLQDIIKFKNAVISGVVSVQCARHGFYSPNGTVDLEKGEAYARTDYALSGPLTEAQHLRWVMLSYDIWCQFYIKFLQRIGAHFPHLLETARRVRGAVPKMHVKGHKADCQVRFSFNYLQYSGETCGEGIESSWSVNNESAGSTKQQNHGHRHDSLDDFFSFWNWLKLQGLAAHLGKKFQDCLERLKKFEEDSVTMSVKHAKHVPLWEKLNTSAEKVGKEWTSVYIAGFKNSRPPTQLKAYDKLVQKAKSKTLQTDGDSNPDHINFINNGLRLEEEQYVLRCHVQSLANADTTTPAQLVNARFALLRSIQQWRVVRKSILPELADSLNNVTTPNPEELPLFLPSHWDGSKRPSAVQLLVDIELQLREGQCHDALDRLRLAIQTFNANLKFKKEYVHGQSSNTRAQAFLRTLSNDKESAFDTYTRAREALIRLGFPRNDKSLQPLLKTQ